MPKRKPRKVKRPTLRDKSNISKKSYANLEREARNARRRLKTFSEREDAAYYDIPDPSDYTLATLVQRVNNGESIRSVLREVRNLRADKIKQGAPTPSVSSTGYVLKPEEKKAIVKAVNTANKNIRQARKKFADFADVLPNEFVASDLISGAVSSESITNKIEDLSLFVSENLAPTAINESGEAGTIAERDYYRRILARENRRRAKNRELNNPTNQEGYFRQQMDYDTQEIDIDNIKTMEDLHKRAEAWDDPARVQRANMYLVNYESSLGLFESVLINNGYYNSTVQERFDYIRDVISRLYFNEEAITFAANRMPDLSIHVISPPGEVAGFVDFDAIYESWIDMEDMFL